MSVKAPAPILISSTPPSKKVVVPSKVHRFLKLSVAAAEAMAIPHLTAPYPELRKIVTLPDVKARPADAVRRSRRAAPQRIA
jgi:hypothetical protein